MIQKRGTTVKQLKVAMHLSRAGERWQLVIEDRASLGRVVEIDFDVETFSDLMSSRMSGNLANCKLYPGDDLGKKHENKEVLVPLPDTAFSVSGTTELYDEAERLNPGWVADRFEERRNMHRVRGSKGERTYAVMVRRWVDVEPEVARPPIGKGVRAALQRAVKKP